MRTHSYLYARYGYYELDNSNKKFNKSSVYLTFVKNVIDKLC